MFCGTTVLGSGFGVAIYMYLVGGVIATFWDTSCGIGSCTGVCGIPGNKGNFAEIGIGVGGTGLCRIPINKGRFAETGVGGIRISLVSLRKVSCVDNCD